MSDLQEGENWDTELIIETGPTKVDAPAVLMTRRDKGMGELDETQSGNGQRDGEVAVGDGGEKVERQEHGGKKVAANDNSKEQKDTESGTGDKRQRPADLDVEVPKGEERGETGAKKAKVTKPGKKNRQQAKATVQVAETKSKGPGRPRKSSRTKKKADTEGGQKSDAKETAKAVN